MVNPPDSAKQNKKSAKLERCGQRYGTESAEGEQRAKEDEGGSGGAAGTEVKLDLCLTVTGEVSALGGTEEETHCEKGPNKAVNERDGKRCVCGGGDIYET